MSVKIILNLSTFHALTLAVLMNGACYRSHSSQC